MSNQEKISAVTQELLEKLGVEGRVSVVEEDGAPAITIDTEEPGLLIGFHGETLKSLELILTFLVSQKLGDFTRVTLDIEGYRKQREERLLSLASKIKEQVSSQGQAQTIPNLTATERRIIHLFFQKDKEVTTESEGEGEARQLIIKPR